MVLQLLNVLLWTGGQHFPWLVVSPSQQTKKIDNGSNKPNANAKTGDGLDDDDSDVTVVPAVVVVCVLATPIILVFVALLIQHMRTKSRVRRAAQKRSLNNASSGRSSSCCCCCFAPKYYYDSERGFDRLVKGYESGEADNFSSTDDEEDLFTRKAWFPMNCFWTRFGRLLYVVNVKKTTKRLLPSCIFFLT